MRVRVAITTTADAVARWVDPFRRRRLHPVALPCVRVVPRRETEDARQAAPDADLLVITSPRTARLVWPDGSMPATPVAAVGPATAVAVERAGGRVAIVGAGTADDLVEELARQAAGRKVLVVTGTSADSSRYGRLSEAGAAVAVVPVYDTRPIGPDSRVPVEGAAFGSPSAVEGWTMTRDLSQPATVVALGPATAEALVRRGARPVVASAPSLEALADALSESLRVRP